MLLKYRSQYASKFGKLSSGHRTGKGQFSFQFQRRAMPKNVKTIVQFCSFHILVRLYSKSFKLCFSSTWTKNFQMSKQDLEKAEEPEIKLPTSDGSQKNQANCRNTSTSASLAMLKSLTVWIRTNCRKFFKRWDYQTTLSITWETCMWVKKQQLKPDMEQLTGSNLRKE